MARCPKLDWESSGSLFGDDKFICTVTGVKMDEDDPKVKHLCKVDYGENYRDCPVYKDCRW